MKKLSMIGIIGAVAAGMYAHMPIEPLRDTMLTNTTTEKPKNIDRAARRRAEREARKKNRK